jgi:DUF1680 family protein
MQGGVAIDLDGGNTVKIVQETNYPWEGSVKLTVTPSQSGEFTLCLRIPGWALGRPVPSDLYRFFNPRRETIGIRINGQASRADAQADGYMHITRSWQAGDTVELNLPMTVRRVLAHEKVEANHGKVALMRGPIVYCLEAVDHPDVDVLTMSLPPRASLKATHRTDLLRGVTVIEGEALKADGSAAKLTAVPYYAWTNREKGAMTVWIKQSP